MVFIINLIWLCILTWFGFKFLNHKDSIVMRLPFCNEKTEMACTGLEALLIFMIGTGLMGLIPLLAIHLGTLELICILGIARAPYKAIYSTPLKFYIVFLLWAAIGIIYGVSVNYGVRMILKYIYPLLIALFASAVIRDVEIFLKAGQMGRRMAVISFITYYIPMSGFIFLGVFWNRAALATNYIVWVVFSIALAYAGVRSKKNILWTIAFCLPALIWVFRTDIFGSSVALATFFFLKYRLKSLPLVIGMAGLALCALFYIPAVKEKMYFRPDEVTMTDFLTGNVDENNINTSGRKQGWEDVERWFYDGHEYKGSGTGRVQHYFYEEAPGWRRGGQLHNDLLVLKCDNGLIGLALFLFSYLAVMFHCMIIYHKSDRNSVKLCASVAGAALMGILVTTYSDNTISYSMATLAYPWAFYGMALGLAKREKDTAGL